jgi:hypothetical protein
LHLRRTTDAPGAAAGDPPVVEGAVSRDELEAIVRQVHHLREEHRRAQVESSARRHLEGRLLEAEGDFERLLEEWLTDDATRDAWREHLYKDGPEPAEPAPKPPLVFRGRSPAGSVAEIRQRPDGDYAVEVDGCAVERIEVKPDLWSTHAPHAFALDGTVFRETFSASPDALAALREFVAERDPRPPWRHAAELAEDGLVDRHLALTARGHRALARG